MMQFIEHGQMLASLLGILVLTSSAHAQGVNGCLDELDVVVVVDGSDSIAGKDYVTLKDALEQFVSSLKMENARTRFGLVLFSADVATQLTLSADKKQLKRNIRALKHPRDGTNTDLGIEAMTLMFQQHGRPGKPWIGIVITDGISKLPVQTSLQAFKAKGRSVQMFALGVGVTGLVDRTELLAIATDANHVKHVPNFRHLNTTLMGLLPPMCSSTTTTTTTTTTPVPTAAPTTIKNIIPAPLAGICERCKMLNGVGYNRHPSDCHKYIQCYFDVQRVSNVVYKECPFGQYWNHDLLTCVRSLDVVCPYERCRNPSVVGYFYDGNIRAYWACQGGRSEVKCCPEGQLFNDVVARCVPDDLAVNVSCPPKAIYDKTPCDKRAVDTDPTVYKQNLKGFGWMIRPCAPGTNYNQTDCRCSVNVAFNPVKKCKPEVYLPFDADTSDKSGFNNFVENYSVTVANGMAYFDGTAKLSVPRYNNVDFGRTLVIKLRYKSEGISTTEQALVSNGDCGLDASVSVTKDAQNTHLHVKTNSGASPALKLAKQAAEWQNVTYILDNGKLEGRVNQASVWELASGRIQSRPCGFHIGEGEGLSNFVGFIDEIYVYRCIPDNL